MNPIHAAAAEIQDFCGRQGWAFCFVGLIHRELDPLLGLKGAPESRVRLDAILRDAVGE